MVDRSTRKDEEALNAVFHCLADPSRRRILALLRESNELKVGDIAAAFEMSLNGVSKHLKVLEAANLVERRVEGRLHYLRVNWAALQPAYEFLHFYQHFWNERLDGLIDYTREKKQTQPTKTPVKNPAKSPVKKRKAKKT
jgi:DNA-binding transcriptional ArsR family regulator